MPAVLWEVGEQARLEQALAMGRRINAPIAVEPGASAVAPDRCGPRRHGVQTRRPPEQGRLRDGSTRQGGHDLARVVRERPDWRALRGCVACGAPPRAPWWATVVGPSPGRIQRARGFSAARGATRARHACARAPA